MRPGTGITTCPQCGYNKAKFYVNTRAKMIECSNCHGIVTKVNNIKKQNPNEADAFHMEDLREEAKKIIRELLKKTYGEGWNYSLDAKVRAENFLKGE